MTEAPNPTPAPTDQPTAPPVEPPTPAQETPATPPAKPETDWKAEARKWESRAKENKGAADKLAEIEEANKTEAERQADRLAQLQAENARLQADALRAQVAAAKGVPADLLAGTTEDELNAAADRLLAFKGEQPPADFGAGQRGQRLDPLQDMQRQYDEAVKAGNVAGQVALKRRMSALQQTTT